MGHEQDSLVDMSFAEGGADPEDLVGAEDWKGIDDATNRDPAVVFVFESMEDKVALLREDPHFDVEPNGKEAKWRPEGLSLFGGTDRDPTQARWYQEALSDERAVPAELAHWRELGLPAFEPSARRISLRVPCESVAQRDALVERYGLKIAKKTREVISAWWPPREREDLSSLRFDVPEGVSPVLVRHKYLFETLGEQQALFGGEGKPIRRRKWNPEAVRGSQVRMGAGGGVEAYCWYGDHWLPASRTFFYRNKKTHHLYLSGRCKDCEKLRRNPPAPFAAFPRYPVYVISKGRWQEDRALTIKALMRDDVPFHVVIEPQELDGYLERLPRERILTLPFSNLGKGSIPARNWVWDHAISEGHAKHWILDDNSMEFRRLWKGRRIPCHAGVALRVCEDFSDAHENVAISGLAYQMFVTAECPTPYYQNVHVYSALLINHAVTDKDGTPVRWRGRYNEDTDLCLQALDAGWCTILVNAFMVNKLKTMAMGGGNSDELYAGDGRLAMARSLESAWPGIVQVRWRFNRPQHVVRWDKFTTPLSVKKDAVVRDHGLSLRAVREVQSHTLRRLLEDA